MKNPETVLHLLKEESPYMMSFVIITREDRAIVIDGGRPEDMPALKACLGGRQIAAWILTHSHNDHYSCFLGFSRMFAEKVEVKRFLLNSPAKDDTVINLAQHDGFLNTTFFDYIKKVTFMYSKTHSIVYFKQACELLWYKANYPDVLSMCFEKTSKNK